MKLTFSLSRISSSCILHDIFFILILSTNWRFLSCCDDVQGALLGFNPSCPNNIKQTSAKEESCTTDDIKNALKSYEYIGSSPWLVSLQDTRYTRDLHYCGGAIIDKCWVLTAAFCVANYQPSDIQVVAGDSDDLDVELEAQVRQIENIILHPQYNDFTRNNDLALIKVMDPFLFDETVSAGNIPRSYSTSQNVTCSISGYTIIETNYVKSPILKHTRQNIITKKTCDSIYPDMITETMICALSHSSASIRVGDWGGALSCTDEQGSNEELIGIASWGLGLSLIHAPTVFVNITYFADWIQSTTEKDPLCDNVE